MSIIPPYPRRILTPAATMERCGITAKSTFHRRRCDPTLKFPVPVVIGGGCIGFLEHEVEDWIAERIRLRDQEGLVRDGRSVVAVGARTRRGRPRKHPLPAPDGEAAPSKGNA